MNKILPSWRTTLAGVAAAGVALLAVVQAYFDNDPATIPNWEVAIGAILAGIGLIFARDNTVTSEQAGAKTTEAAAPK